MTTKKQRARGLAAPDPSAQSIHHHAPPSEDTTLPSPPAKRKTANIPDAQRGERGELLAVRVTRGTRELVATIAKAWECPQGEVIEAALAALGAEGAWVRTTSAAGRRQARRCR